jgi:hypothetical protein
VAGVSGGAGAGEGVFQAFSKAVEGEAGLSDATRAGVAVEGSLVWWWWCYVLYSSICFRFSTSLGGPSGLISQYSAAMTQQLLLSAAITQHLLLSNYYSATITQQLLPAAAANLDTAGSYRALYMALYMRSGGKSGRGRQRPHAQVRLGHRLLPAAGGRVCAAVARGRAGFFLFFARGRAGCACVGVCVWCREEKEGEEEEERGFVRYTHTHTHTHTHILFCLSFRPYCYHY